MTIDLKDVENVAQLARLQLDDAEKQAALDSFTRILALIDQMQSVDTSQVNPLQHANDAASQRLRDDVVTETDQRDTLLALAPDADQGLYQVPKVIE